MKTVKKTVSSLDGVDKVEVDFSNKVATITMKDGKTLEKKDLDEAFGDGKFKVTKFEAEKTEDAEKSKDE